MLREPRWIRAVKWGLLATTMLTGALWAHKTTRFYLLVRPLGFTGQDRRNFIGAMIWLGVEGLLLAAMGLGLLFSLRRRIPPGHCQKCGYDLTGNSSGRCPECGQTLDGRSDQGQP